MSAKLTNVIVKDKADTKASPVIVSLERALRTVSARMAMCNDILSHIPNKKPDQCITSIEHTPAFLTILKKLGEGSFGNVFLGEIGSIRLAVKQGKSSKFDINHPYDNMYDSWAEINILNKIIKPALEGKMCPNLPLLYKDFYCPKCKFEFDDVKSSSACVINLTELATGGDLLSLLKAKSPTDLDIYIALFQVLAGLHALQNFGVFHNDIKAENILIYDVEPGGCYEYIVMGKRYYVPNNGKLIILNDFGVSKTFAPKYGYGAFIYDGTRKNGFLELGTRNVMIHKNTVVPLFIRDTVRKDRLRKKITFKGKEGFVYNKVYNTRGGKLYINFDQEAKLEYYSFDKDEYKKFDIDTFNNVDLFPPAEYASDVTDVLHTFIGGLKRVTQPGSHSSTNVSKHVKNKLLKYTISSKIKDVNDSKPYHLLAKYLFSELFADIFGNKYSEPVIETYTLS